MERAIARAHHRIYRASVDPAHHLVGEAFEAPMVRLLATHLKGAGLDPELARPALRDLRKLTESHNVALGSVVVSRKGPVWGIHMVPAHAAFPEISHQRRVP
jgi:hypothetical protein